MKDKIFIDTNVFIYAYSDDDATKHKIAENLLQKAPLLLVLKY